MSFRIAKLLDAEKQATRWIKWLLQWLPAHTSLASPSTPQQQLSPKQTDEIHPNGWKIVQMDEKMSNGRIYPGQSSTYSVWCSTSITVFYNYAKKRHVFLIHFLTQVNRTIPKTLHYFTLGEGTYWFRTTFLHERMTHCIQLFSYEG
jgi:hypothetical protein